ncbi:hypothetical protein ACHAXT_004749 [Thalassiosira profunda]
MGKSDPSLDPLHKTVAALKEIRTNLLPFIKMLKESDEASGSRGRKRGRPSDSANQTADAKTSNCGNDGTSTNDGSDAKTTKLTPHRRAEAEAAVSLALGTLRYMGARLRGLDRGRKKGDPLRAELDKMRGLLVALRKVEEGTKKEEKEGKKEDDGGESSPKKKQRTS